MTIIEQLILHEGLRLRPYVDTVGKLTIGVGRNLTDVGITEEEAQLLLANDLERVRKDLETFSWFHTLDEVRRRVVMDMRFNLGPTGFRGFVGMIAALARRDYQAAALHMQESKWCSQVGLRGVRLVGWMRTGVE